MLSNVHTICKTWKQSKCLCMCVYVHIEWNITQLIERYLAVCNNMNGSRGYAKRIKSDRKRQIPHGLTLIWKTKQSENRLTDTEENWVVAKREGCREWTK